MNRWCSTCLPCSEPPPVWYSKGAYKLPFSFFSPHSTVPLSFTTFKLHPTRLCHRSLKTTPVKYAPTSLGNPCCHMTGDDSRWTDHWCRRSRMVGYSLEPDTHMRGGSMGPASSSWCGRTGPADFKNFELCFAATLLLSMGVAACLKHALWRIPFQSESASHFHPIACHVQLLNYYRLLHRIY